MKISEHVYFYPAKARGKMYGSNSVVINGNEQILIDPGPAKEEFVKRLETLMKKDGISFEDIDEIWITHAHPDHIAAVGKLVKKFHCRVRCHPASVALFESPSPVEYYCAQMARELNKTNLKVVSQIFETFPWFPRKLKIKKIVIPLAVNRIKIFNFLLHLVLLVPSLIVLFSEKLLKRSYGEMFSVRVHMSFADGKIIKNGQVDIQTIFCPGHAHDEVAFYIPKEEILITGDLVKAQKRRGSQELLPFIPVLNSQDSDFGEALSSVKKLNNLNVKTLVPAHRRQLSGKALIRKCLSKMIGDMEKIKSQVIELKEKKADNPEIIKYIITTLSENYPHCSQQEQITYSYLLLKHLGHVV